MGDLQNGRGVLIGRGVRYVRTRLRVWLFRKGCGDVDVGGEICGKRIGGMALGEEKDQDLRVLRDEKVFAGGWGCGRIVM